jgi:hypothetical protein
VKLHTRQEPARTASGSGAERCQHVQARVGTWPDTIIMSPPVAEMQHGMPRLYGSVSPVHPDWGAHLRHCRLPHSMPIQARLL